MLNFAHINAMRKEELQRVLDQYRDFFAGKDLLEIGSGTGRQLKTLSHICKSAVGIEVTDVITGVAGDGDYVGVLTGRYAADIGTVAEKLSGIARC